MKTEIPTSIQISRTVGRPHLQTIPGGPLAIYVHWPFCRSKCPYCDFNSHVRDSIDEARWRRALLAELDAQAAAIGRREVVSVFFGGGTPSLMPPDTVAAIITRIRELWQPPDGVEITLEANPNSAEAERFRALAQAGINRLSLGIQSLDPASLRFLGRRHDRDEAIAAIGRARDNFERYSFDLIYARPGQSLDAWRRELGEALSLAGEHLSLYQLTIEPGTAFAPAAARGDFILPDEDDAATLFEATQEIMAGSGRPAYEISNHARPGAECRHNLAYWRYEDYLGIGPGAHGRVTADGIKQATRQFKAPETWIAAVESGRTGCEEMIPVASEAALEEMLMMGLRLGEGIPRHRIEAMAGQAVEPLFGRALLDLVEGGFLTLDGQRLAATPAGSQRLNAVLARLVSAIEPGSGR